MPPEGNWRDALPEEMRGNESLSTFEDIGALAKGFIDAKAYQGSSVKIPGEDAGADDVKAFNEKMIEKMPTLMYKPDMENQEQSVEFYRTLGMPEGPDGYEIPKVEVPESIEMGGGKAEAFRGIAHKYGLTAAQFKGVMGDVMAQDIVDAQANQKDVADNMIAIKEKFGHAFSDNMGKINLMLSKTGAPETLVDAVKGGMIDVNMINWMYTMGKQMGGEGFNFDDADVNDNKTAKMTPEDAQNAIAEINANPDHAYWKGTGVDKKRATDRMIELMKFANPTAPVEIARA